MAHDREESSRRNSRLRDQQERALQVWSLHVDLDAAALTAGSSRALRRILRIKRSERDAVYRALPGVVRRGARADLEATLRALTAAGIPCRLEADARSSGAETRG